MSLLSIPRNQLFRLFVKSVYNRRSSNLIKYRKYAVTRFLPNPTKYFCFAFLNILYVAEATSMTNLRPEEEEIMHTKENDIKDAIAQADDLFSIGKYKDSLNILEPFKDSENVEVLWRISRALFNMSKQKGIKSSENANLINKAYECIEAALQLDENHFAVHKWMAILYDAKCALNGLKARINGLPVFKEHLMKAVELNPKDATSIYMLGQYMYNIADMSWLQKTIATTLFGTPPSASFEEAFYYFNKAEEVDPNFYSANLLMLGKTCIKLKRIQAGCYWLKCAIAYPVRTDEDEAVRLEANELLSKFSTGKETVEEEEEQADN